MEGQHPRAGLAAAASRPEGRVGEEGGMWTNV